MELFRLALCLIAAPAIYFFVGLPWAARTRLAWAPLWGVAVLGLGAEAAALARLPVLPSLLALGGLHLLVAAGLSLRHRFDEAALRRAARDFLRAYAIALVPVAVAPFALPGGWGGDWLQALEAGRHLLAGTPFPAELLARPPLFGAAAIPLLGLGLPFASFQVFCAIASACVLAAFEAPADRPAAARFLPWVLAGGIFFLQITANAWPKFLCAAFLLAAWRAPREQVRRAPAVTGAWLGLAIATHQSAVLFAPLVLHRLWSSRPAAPGRWRAVAWAAVAAAAIVLPWEIHTVATYGWAAKWHANPAVSQRLADVPAWLNALLVGVTTFVAWGPVAILGHWLAAPDRFTAVRVAHELYWLATATFNSLAGSLLGLVLPWVAAWGFRDFRDRAAAAWSGLDRGAKVGLAAALAGQMLLNPFYSSEGSLQTGWVPVGVALAWWFAGEVAAAEPARRRRLWLCLAALGAGPWLVFNGGLTAALALVPGFQPELADTDLQALAARGWSSLALAGFPWLQLGLAALWAWLALRRRLPGFARGGARLANSLGAT